MLRAINLTKRFAGFIAVDGTSIDITKGSITACVGPNGAGKSTLVNLLSGLLAPDEGSITINGKDVTRSPAWARASQGLRRTFQNTTGIGELSVYENLELGMWRRHSAPQGPSTSAKARPFDLNDLIQFLDLQPYRFESLNRLPLGIQRKVGIGAALIGQPSYLLLDEPLAGTEASDRRMLLQAFRDLARIDLGLMWIEHDLASVRSTADLLVVIDKGRVIAQGPVETVVADTAVQEAYWGSTDVA